MENPNTLLNEPATLPKKTRVMQVFLSAIGTCNYPFGNAFRAGKIAHFISGQYLTDDEHEIAELDNEIKLGHPHIHRPKAEDKRQVDILADPLQAVRDKAIADYLAEQEAARLAALNRGSTGNTEEGLNKDNPVSASNTGIGTSANVGTTAALSNSNSAAGISAKLAALKTK